MQVEMGYKCLEFNDCADCIRFNELGWCRSWDSIF
jgi:hypothetical protein